MNPFFFKGFSPYVPGAPGTMTVTDFVTGIVHPRHEILALLPVMHLTGKSSGVTFNLADEDLDRLVADYVTKMRATWMGVGDAVNVVPDIMRDFAAYGLGEDTWQLQNIARTGAAVPATGAAAEDLYIPLGIPFINVQKENPNLNAYSAGQLYNGATVNIDHTGVALPRTTVLVNGSFVASAFGMELWGLMGGIRSALWMTGAQKYFQRAASSQQQENEGGPLFDEIVFGVQDAATFPNGNDKVQVLIDGKNFLMQTPTRYLPMGFSATVRANETAVPSYDITQNNKARAAAARTGRTPFVWVQGITRPLEREWPVVAGGRNINFGQGMTATAQLAFWRQTSILTQENLAHFANMLADSRLQTYFTDKVLSPSQIDAIKRLNFNDFAIDGGGSAGIGAMNSDLSMWKPRMFVPRRGAGG